MIATWQQRDEFFLESLKSQYTFVDLDDRRPCRVCAIRKSGGRIKWKFIDTHFTLFRDGKCVECNKIEKKS